MYSQQQLQTQQNYGYQNLAQPILHRSAGSMQQGLSSQLQQTHGYGFPNQSSVPIQHMPVPQPTPVTHQAPVHPIALTGVQSALAQQQPETNQLPKLTQQPGMARDPTLTQLAMATSSLHQPVVSQVSVVPATPIPAPPTHLQQTPMSQPAVAQTPVVQPVIAVPTPQPSVTAAPETGVTTVQPLAAQVQDPVKIAEENRRSRKRNRERVRRSEIGEQV